MPSGRPDVIPVVLELLMRRNPASVLDVGAGFGKWGLLLREYLEVWQGRLMPDAWEKRIDAIECFDLYTTLPWYGVVYNKIYRTRVEAALDLLGQYDVVLLADIVEHLPRDVGTTVLGACRAYVATTPGYASDQGTVFGNPAEAHQSRWEPGDFRMFTRTKSGMIVGWNI